MSANPPIMPPITAPTEVSLFFLHSNSYMLYAVKYIYMFLT